MDDFSELNMDASSTLLDATIKSLPATSCLDTSLLNELRDQLIAVQRELESAHEEIGNLNNENLQLRQQITEMDKKIDVLIKLTTQPSSHSSTPKNKFLTPLSSNRSIRSKRNILANVSNHHELEQQGHGNVAPKGRELDEEKTTGKHNVIIQGTDKLDDERRAVEPPGPVGGPTQEQEQFFFTRCETNEDKPTNNEDVITHRGTDKITNEEDTIESPGPLSDPTQKQNKEKRKTGSNIEDDSAAKTLKKIHILGDHTGLGLAQKLIDSRKLNWNNNYAISGFCKPEATSVDILSSCDNIIEHSNKDDIVILTLGSNDKEPYKYVFELCNALYKLQNLRVFVVKVPNNVTLNSGMQNHYTKLLCKHFKNVKFIEVDASNHRSLCFKLNIEIDSIDYERQFLNRLKLNTCLPKTSNNLYKKGTIPYLFQKQQNKNTKRNKLSERNTVITQNNHNPAQENVNEKQVFLQNTTVGLKPMQLTISQVK